MFERPRVPQDRLLRLHVPVYPSPELVEPDPPASAPRSPSPTGCTLNPVDWPRVDLLEAQLGVAGRVGQLVEHLDLDALHRVHRHIEEVPRAARRPGSRKRSWRSQAWKSRSRSSAALRRLAASRGLTFVTSQSWTTSARTAVQRSRIGSSTVGRTRRAMSSGGVYSAPSRCRSLGSRARVSSVPKMARSTFDQSFRAASSRTVRSLRLRGSAFRLVEEVAVEAEELLETEALTVVHGPPQLLPRRARTRRG